MKVLVANLGSTSFKYRLFDMSDPAEPVLARGAIERIGSPTAKVLIKSARGDRELVCPIADHGEAVQLCLDQLTDPEIGVVRDASEVAAIGFKAVHARNLTGVHLVDETVLAEMEADLANIRTVQNASVIQLDDSRLGQIKGDLERLRERIDIERTKIELTGQFLSDPHSEVKVTESNSDVVEQVRTYFSKTTESAKKAQ